MVEKAKAATNADQLNDAIQKIIIEYPFVGAHMSVITAMRVRALSLNAFQETIGITPLLNSIHVDYKVLTAPATHTYNSLKDNAIKKGTYSKQKGQELLSTYRKRLSGHWNYISCMYEIKISDFTLFDMTFLMRLSGYKGPVRANKANKKQLKEIVFPTIMSYIQKFLNQNPEVFQKPYVTKGVSKDSEFIPQYKIDECDNEVLSKFHLHSFITGPELIKLIIKKHNESGFGKQEDSA